MSAYVPKPDWPTRFIRTQECGCQYQVETWDNVHHIRAIWPCWKHSSEIWESQTSTLPNNKVGRSDDL